MRNKITMVAIAIGFFFYLPLMIKILKEHFVLILILLFTCLIYSAQYFHYGIINNNAVFELYSYFLSICLFIGLFGYKEEINKRFLILCMVATYGTFILATTKSGGYSFINGAGGILSAFMVLLVLLMLNELQGKVYRLLEILFFILLLAMQVRITLLSYIVFYILLHIDKKNILKLVVIGLPSILIIITMLGETRIFAQHTSGRVYHWLVIFNDFDFNNLFAGMGVGSGSSLLIDLGKEESMAAVHNEYLRYFYDLGIFGLVTVLLLLSVLFFNTNKTGKILTTILAMQMFTDNVGSYFSPYTLSVILLITSHWKQGKAALKTIPLSNSGACIQPVIDGAKSSHDVKIELA